jgi:hypothetical protein
MIIMKLTKNSIVVVASAIVLYACSSNVKSEEVLAKNNSKDTISEVTNLPVKDSIYIDSFFTDVALTIGGFDNNFAKKRGLVSNYPTLVSKQFNAFTKSKLNPISSWVKQNTMIPEKYACQTLFYPLAGADFVYANAFFNNVKNYILVGLEKPGYLPNYDQLNNVALESYRSQIFNSLDVSMKSGFFRTNSMRVQFNQKTVNGTLHSLLFYLARTGNKIRTIHEINS